MDNAELFLKLAKEYGLAMGNSLFILWIYVINPMRKKRKGNYVSYHTIDGKFGLIDHGNKERDGRIDRIEQKIFDHGESLLERERKLEDITTEQKRFDRSLEEMKYMMRDFIATQKTTNRLLGENKDAMRELLAYLKKQNGA